MVIDSVRPRYTNPKKNLRAVSLILRADEEPLFDADSQRDYPTGNCDSERYHRHRSLADDLVSVRQPVIPLQPLVIHRIEILGAEALIN